MDSGLTWLLLMNQICSGVGAIHAGFLFGTLLEHVMKKQPVFFVLSP